MTNKTQIKFPLNEEEKQCFRDRLEEVLSQNIGEQVIILWDKDKLTDYYQNMCIPMLLKHVEKSAEEYAELAGELLYKHEK